MTDSSLEEISCDVNIIREDAFYNCKTLKKVSLTNLNGIERYAFYGCTALEKVYLGGFNGCNGEIDHRAFEGCWNIKEVYVDEGCEDVIENLRKAFSDSKNVRFYIQK